MADLPSILSVLEHDPDDVQALEALTGAARHSPPDIRATRFAAARKVLAGRGRPDALVQLLDIELAATGDLDRKIDLLIEKGIVLDGELLDVPAARAAFEEVRALRPEDSLAREALEEIEIAASNWQKFAEKYVREATASTDRSLATGLYVSAAEAFVRFAPDAPEAEAYLRKALEIDPRNGKAAFHLVRLLRRRKPAERDDRCAGHVHDAISLECWSCELRLRGIVLEQLLRRAVDVLVALFGLGVRVEILARHRAPDDVARRRIH